MPFWDLWTCRYTFSSNLQQNMGVQYIPVYIFWISFTANGPQRTRLPVPRTATLPSSLWSRSVFPSHASCYGNQNKTPDFVKHRTLDSELMISKVSTGSTRGEKGGRTYVCMYGRTYSKSIDQPGKVANPARGQLNRENIFPCARSRLRIWSRETGPAVPSRVSLLIFILRLNLVHTYRIPPEFRGGVHLFI